MDWFRHYHGCSTDPKWRTVARRTGQSIERVVWVWDNLMEYASDNEDDRGSVEGWDAEVAADHLMCEVDAIEKIRAEFDRLGVVFEGRLSAWERRQPADPTAAERMRRYRERKRTQANEEPAVTSPESPEAPPVTAEPTPRDDTVIVTPDNARNDERNDRNAERNPCNELHQRRTDKNREDKNLDTAPAKADARRYSWAGDVIRLNERDLGQWRKAFRAIDLEANLTDIDAWLANKASAEDRKNWFHIVPAILRKRHEKTRAEAGAQARASPGEGVRTVEGFVPIPVAEQRKLEASARRQAAQEGLREGTDEFRRRADEIFTGGLEPWMNKHAC